MSELASAATGAKPAGLVAKTSLRAAVALTMSIGCRPPDDERLGEVLHPHSSAAPMLALSATAAFGLFELRLRGLPSWLGAGRDRPSEGSV
jgi:hypothetical protein